MYRGICFLRAVTAEWTDQKQLYAYGEAGWTSYPFEAAKQRVPEKKWSVVPLPGLYLHGSLMRLKQ